LIGYFCWNAVGLARKLKEYEDYYNAHRVHRSLGGTTPAQCAGASSAAPALIVTLGGTFAVVCLDSDRRLTNISPPQVRRDVTADKTACDERLAAQAHHRSRRRRCARKVVRDLSAVFSFAIRSEILPRNPCESAAVRKTDNRNERFLTLDEVTLLGAALDAL